MRALYFDGTLRVGERAAPEAGPGEALVRVTLAGVCNTDLEIARGYMGFRGVLGHEFVGVVEACEDRAWTGRRVAGEINLACGACARCRGGLGRHCPARTVLGILGKDGCFAEYVTLPRANLHPLPDALDDELAVFVEPVAACFEVLEQLRVEPGSRVAVLGDGKLGILLAQVLRGTGCELVLGGRHARKLALAEGLGLNARPASELAPGFDVVVEATGAPAGLARALELLRPRGTLVLKSTFHGSTEIPTARLVIDEITLVGSRCGPFAPAVRALAAARVDPRPLVDARYPLADGVAALGRASSPGVLKVLLDPRA